MKALFSKIAACLLIASFVLCLVSCGSDDKAQADPVNTGSQQQTGNNDQPQDTTGQGDNTESSLLSGTYKVARKDIYVDVPNYNMIEEGYTRIFLDGSNKYITFTCVKNEAADNLRDAHDVVIERVKRNVFTHHQINEIADVQITEVTINSIDTLKFEGTCNAGHNPVYDAYTYGYSFIYEGLPCAIIGVVRDNEQPEAEKQLVKQIVDEMMKTVRNSQ